MLALPDDAGLGLALPTLQSPQLRGDLHAAGAPFCAALAPLPTVTCHARRALFAGEIPGNSALDDTESPAANASADTTAWGRNQSLGDLPHRLFLKGDLGADSAVLIAALADPSARLLAVVFNGVDDALASHETTPLPPWTWDGLGAGAISVLRTAVGSGWTVVVTADHGHTPFLDASRQQPGRGQPARFATSPVEDAVRLDRGALPVPALWASTALGAFRGQQRRGFHGGAGLEEVVVPLAFLGPVSRGAGRPRAPVWWWSLESAEEEATEPIPTAPDPIPTGPSTPPALPVDLRSHLAERPDALRAVETIARLGVLDLPQLARALGRPAFLLGGMMGTVQQDLVRAGVPVPFSEEGEGMERVYRWKTGA
jgi:hypothetical protein